MLPHHHSHAPPPCANTAVCQRARPVSSEQGCCLSQPSSDSPSSVSLHRRRRWRSLRSARCSKRPWCAAGPEAGEGCSAAAQAAAGCRCGGPHSRQQTACGMQRHGQRAADSSGCMLCHRVVAVRGNTTRSPCRHGRHIYFRCGGAPTFQQLQQGTAQATMIQPMEHMREPCRTHLASGLLYRSCRLAGTPALLPARSLLLSLQPPAALAAATTALPSGTCG